jgi:hypothetical protein
MLHGTSGDDLVTEYCISVLTDNATIVSLSTPK